MTSEAQTRQRRRRAYRELTKSMRVPRAAKTSLGYGCLFPILDPKAKLAWTMTSRPMTRDEWVTYSRDYSARKRRTGEVVES